MIKDTLYAKYIKEREDLEVLENESGFITYKISGKECFIANMYVEADQQRKGRGHILIMVLEKLAKNHGCEFLSANIHLKDHGASKTLIAALLVGFEVKAADLGVLVIIKDISGGK
jgi:GNAT superfamily N-acetyltransferase